MIVALDVASISALATFHNQRHIERLQVGPGPVEEVAYGVLLVDPLHDIRGVSREVIRNSLRTLNDDVRIRVTGDLTLLKSVGSEQAVVRRVSAIDRPNETQRG